MNRNKYIARIDSGRTHCWFLRMPPIPGKSFSDGVYKGKRKALQAAREYRDSILREAGEEWKLKVESSRNGVPSRTSAKNRSGYIGVHYGVDVKDGAGSPYWKVTWREDGKTRARQFFVGEHGDCGAFRLSCKIRYERVGELRQVSRYTFAPCDPGVPVVKSFE